MNLKNIILVFIGCNLSATNYDLLMNPVKDRFSVNDRPMKALADYEKHTYSKDRTNFFINMDLEKGGHQTEFELGNLLKDFRKEACLGILVNFINSTVYTSLLIEKHSFAYRKFARHDRTIIPLSSTVAGPTDERCETIPIPRGFKIYVIGKEMQNLNEVVVDFKKLSFRDRINIRDKMIKERTALDRLIQEFPDDSLVAKIYSFI